MDAKVTLSFNEAVIKKAKRYAANNNISLSRLIEFLLQKATNSQYQSLEELPVAEWVHTVAEGEVEYKTKPRKLNDLKSAYFKSKK